ncbi:MAG: hypothetical protein WCX79_00800 [Candidatus Paceibacterota bacterium]|jgi:hypothetical protein
MRVKIILIATLVVISALVCSVGAMPDPNKYAPVVINNGDGTGSLYIQAMCGHTLITKDVIIQEVVLKDEKYNLGTMNALIQKDNLNLYNPVGENKTIELDANGKYDAFFKPGIYALTFLNEQAAGNEYAIAQVNANYKTQINFAGHGVTKADEN